MIKIVPSHLFLILDYKAGTMHQDSRRTGRLRESPGSDPRRAGAAQDGEDAQGAAQRGAESHARRGVDISIAVLIFQPGERFLPVIYDIIVLLFTGSWHMRQQLVIITWHKIYVC